MARNPGKALTPTDVATIAANRTLLSNRMGEVVTLSYVKRQDEATGTLSTMVGTVVAFPGTRQGGLSTEAVTLETDKGERSANLWNIKAIH